MHTPVARAAGTWQNSIPSTVVTATRGSPSSARARTGRRTLDRGEALELHQVEQPPPDSLQLRLVRRAQSREVGRFRQLSGEQSSPLVLGRSRGIAGFHVAQRIDQRPDGGHRAPRRLGAGEQHNLSPASGVFAAQSCRFIGKAPPVRCVCAMRRSR